MSDGALGAALKTSLQRKRQRAANPSKRYDVRNRARILPPLAGRGPPLP